MRQRPFRVGAGVLLVALVVIPSSARAATASVRPFSRDPIPFPAQEVVYDAAPGETNAVAITVEPAPGATWTINDAGATITPGSGCTAVDSNTVRCIPDRSDPFSIGLLAAELSLGDGNDTVTFSPSGVDSIWRVYADGGLGDDMLSGAPGGGELDGGAGNDELHAATTFTRTAVLDGGPGDDHLFGGDGSDDLRGGGGQDELRAGAGDDVLSDGDIDGDTAEDAPGADLIDGGPGTDVVSYAQRTQPLSIDLQSSGGQGETGEGDTLTGIESAVGGSAADRLAGDQGANRLDGAGGRNQIAGRSGDDTLRTGAGQVACGAGRDLVDGPSALAYLQPGCERVASDRFDSDTEMSAYPDRRRPRWVGYYVHCFRNPDEGTRDPCAAKLSIHEAMARHRRLAGGSLRVGPWAHHLLRAHLTAVGRRLAARPGGVLATVRFTGHGPARWTIRLASTHPSLGVTRDARRSPARRDSPPAYAGAERERPGCSRVTAALCQSSGWVDLQLIGQEAHADPA